ncbi:hypothetical protein BIW11_12334, partial [Tropilaelaps mercedesae]
MPFRNQKNSDKTLCDLIYVMWSVACTLLRLIVVCKAGRRNTSSCFRDAVERLREVSLLGEGPVTPRYVCLSFRLLVLTMLGVQLYTQIYAWSASHGATSLTVLLNPTFIILAIEFALYCSAWMQACGWLVLLTYGPVSKASVNALDYFKTAVKAEDIHMFQRAVIYHERCIDLIRSVDCVAGAVLGVNLTVTIPLFAMLGTKLLTPGDSFCFADRLNLLDKSWAPQIGLVSWCVGAVCAIIMGCTVANHANMA